MDELDIEDYCRSQKSRHGQWDQTGKLHTKLQLLDSKRLVPVRRLYNLNCSEDPLWAQQLLEQMSYQLDELEMRNVHKGHLMAVEKMKNLNRLCVEMWDSSLDKEPYMFQPRYGLDTMYGLTSLQVFLPKEMTFSLIAANRNSLKELELSVGLKLRMNSRYWTCKDLAKRLAEIDLPLISGIILRRGDEMEGFHPKERCDAQIASLKARFPQVGIYCHTCAEIPW